MNALQSFLSSEMVTAFGWALLHSLWQGAVIAIVAALIMTLQRKYNPKVRYAVFYGLLMLIPVSFAITFVLVYSPGSETLPRAVHPQILSGPQLNGSINSTLSTETAGSSGWISGLSGFFEGRMHWLFLLWFGGFLVFMIRFAGSMAYIYRLRTFRLIEVGGEMQKRLEGLSERMGMKKIVRLKESALVQVPMTIGYLKPVILFPIGLLSSVPVQQIDAILLHELAHIYRRDYLLNILQSFVEMLFFYHPVTWWLSGLVRVEREHVCDDIALSIHHDRINYIKALTTMEELNVKSPLLATAVTGPRKKLLHRVTRLVHPEKLTKGFSDGIIGFLVLAAIIITISANAIAIAGSGDEPLGNESLDGFRISVPALNNFTEKETEVLPVENPDTIITKSGSGKITVKVISDTTDNLDEKDMKVIVMSKDGMEWESQSGGQGQKKVITLKMEGEGQDSIKSVIVIKDGDSVCDPFIYHWESPDYEGVQKYYFNFRNDSIDTAFVFTYPEDFDNDFDFDYDFDIDIEEQDMAKYMQEHEKAMQEYGKVMHEYEFQIQGEELERAMKEQERAMREYELQYKDMDGQHREMEFFMVPPESPGTPMEWYGAQPEMSHRSTEKVIRQELRDDGLVSHGRSYIVEISSKSMYINGEKQAKEVSKKYMHLVEGLEPGMLDESGSYKIVF